MFLGHYAAALAAKRAAPRTSLGTLVFACQLLDLIWPIFLLLGWERVRIDPGNTAFTPLDFESYPISHSLVAVLGWSLLVGGAYLVLRKDRRGAVVVALVVASHWVLDWITHRPDLALVPGAGPKVGLELWRSVAATVAVELTLWVGAVWIYVRTTRPADGRGIVAFWSMVSVLTLIYVGNLFGPPPPDVTSLAVVSLVLWVVVPWAAWADRHRQRRFTSS